MERYTFCIKDTTIPIVIDALRKDGFYKQSDKLEKKRKRELTRWGEPYS